MPYYFIYIDAQTKVYSIVGKCRKNEKLKKRGKSMPRCGQAQLNLVEDKKKHFFTSPIIDQYLYCKVSLN